MLTRLTLCFLFNLSLCTIIVISHLGVDDRLLVLIVQAPCRCLRFIQK